MKSLDAEIVIAGGGLVGLTLAVLLRAADRDPPLRIAVVESHAPEPVGDEVGLRVSALAPASQAVLEQCNAWQRLPAARLSPYLHMRVWRNGGPDGPQSIGFDAAEQGLAVLGHIVENEVLRRMLWEQAASLGVELIECTKFASARREPDRLCLTLADGRRLDTALLVGADGAASRVREAFGMNVRRRSYGQQGVVMHVASELPHQQTAWQRFLPGGPVALLPLADGRSSVVWSCPDVRAEALMAAGDKALSVELSVATDHVLGELDVTTEVGSFPLVAAHAPAYCQERVALAGDAAHLVHPLAGQGVNLGLRDAAELAAQLLQHARLPHADLGDSRVLRRYERARKADNLLTLSTMDLFHRVFSSGNPALAAAGGLGLAVANRLPLLKRRFAAQAAGGAPPLS